MTDIKVISIPLYHKSITVLSCAFSSSVSESIKHKYLKTTAPATQFVLQMHLTTKELYVQ
jgi:hypothetical protein